MKSASSLSLNSVSSLSSGALQLGCLAASPASVRAAVDSGADWVRIPYRLRNSTYGNVKNDRLSNAIRYVHGMARKAVLDLALSSPALSWSDCRNMIAWAEQAGFDAIALSDIATALYCAARHPKLPVHFVAPDSVRGRTATLLKMQLNASRILVPGVISTAQLVEISSTTNVIVEILGFGTSPHANAVDTTAGSSCQDCDGCDDACNDSFYSAKQHLYAALHQLPLLASLGIRVIHVESRNDIPSEVRNVARVWRAAIDRCLEDGSHFAVDPAWHKQLSTRSGRC